MKLAICPNKKQQITLAIKDCVEVALEQWKNSEIQLKPQELIPSILLVEDCPMQQKLFAKIIESKLEEFNLPPCTIHKCQTGELAATIANYEHSKHNLKLIVLDLTLSDMSGIDLLPRLPQSVPVLCVSASDEPFIAKKINNFNNVFKFIKKGSIITVEDWADIKKLFLWSFSKLVS